MTDSQQYKALTYASAGVSALSAISGAFTQSAAYRAQGDIESTISRINANIANLQSSEALEAGDIAASRAKLKYDQEAGSVLSSQGASGVDVSSGSSALVRNSIRFSGAQDALTIRNNAQRQAFGYKTQALQATYSGKISQLTANAQSEQALLNGGLSAIRGPLSIYANSQRWQRFERGSGDNAPFPDEEV